MKIKSDFVTNSSSTAYIIYNKTSDVKTLVDFVKENPHIVEEYLVEYDWNITDKFNQQAMIESAEKNNALLRPGENYISFGDEDGTIIGQVYDYMLREGGESDSFTWKFEEYLR